jgi:hypothetical protein
MSNSVSRRTSTAGQVPHEQTGDPHSDGQLDRLLIEVEGVLNVRILQLMHMLQNFPNLTGGQRCVCVCVCVCVWGGWWYIARTDTAYDECHGSGESIISGYLGEVQWIH